MNKQQPDAERMRRAVQLAWHLMKLNGSTVVKGNERIELWVDSDSDEELEPVALDPGDLIVIAGQSCYWFGERQERSMPPNA